MLVGIMKSYENKKIKSKSMSKSMSKRKISICFLTLHLNHTLTLFY